MHLAEQLCANPNYSRLRTMLFNKGISEPVGFKTFVEFYLPYQELPRMVKFDSSFERANKLLQTVNCPIVYGNLGNKLFAIEYEWNCEHYLTIFLEGIDYRQDFIDGLRRYTPEISEELAKHISDSLLHDSYYALSKTQFFDNSKNRLPEAREKVAMQYANMVAWRSYARPGEDILDILNGPTAIFSLNKSKYADIDDEKPACFTIDGILYIYQP